VAAEPLAWAAAVVQAPVVQAVQRVQLAASRPAGPPA